MIKIKKMFNSNFDSEVNHKRHFIKIPFINKGMEFIDLHSIFKHGGNAKLAIFAGDRDGTA